MALVPPRLNPPLREGVFFKKCERTGKPEANERISKTPLVTGKNNVPPLNWLSDR